MNVKEHTSMDCINEVYRDLDHYIVIGLTGRCGSGCSATREILCGSNQYNPTEYLGMTQNEEITNVDRDREIILNFSKNSKVLPFDVIRVRDILTSYILEKKENFFELLYILNGDPSEDPDKIKNDFYKHFNENFTSQATSAKKNSFDIFSQRSKEIWGAIEKDEYEFIQHISKKQYKFLFEDLRKISDVIRTFLISRGRDEYTLVYQHVGNIIRLYGSLDLTQSCNLTAENSSAIARRINLIIKVLRRKQWIEANYKKKSSDREKIYKSSVHVVIDSIKNIQEANYLKSRYHSFYLVALTLDDVKRKQRLKLSKGLTDSEIEIIDIREEASKAKKIWKAKEKGTLDENQEIYKKIMRKDDPYTALFWNCYENSTNMFYLQDVDGCIQNADILINNNESKEELKLKIMRYVCLMMHPGLVPPTPDERCMQIAQTAKLNSGCISRQVGAVICDKNGDVLSIGWNDPSTTKGNECISCIRRSLDGLLRKEDEAAYSYYELYDEEFRKYILGIFRRLVGNISDVDSMSVEQLLLKLNECLDSSTNALPMAFCFKDIYSKICGDRNQVHTRAQHAEERALERCEKERASGGTLYTTSSSCELCAKKALSYDIRRIVYIEQYSGLTNDHILGHSVKNGTKIKRDKLIRTEPISVELFTGATQTAYTELYSPAFPLKDELSLRGLTLN